MSPTTKRMKFTRQVTSIEDLPSEMISELFEYLPLKDLATCSMVNKRWHSIYAVFRVHRLAMICYHSYCYPEFELSQWYDASRRIEEKERCRLEVFSCFAEKRLLSNLRQLALAAGDSFQFDLNKLNRFEKLVHLEIEVHALHERKVHLNLPRLKVLAFHHYNSSCSLSIDCPQLSTLVYREERSDANLLNVKHPKTIRKLVTNMIYPKWLASFESIECLATWQYEAISKATLQSLPKLRELRYNGSLRSVFEKEFEEEVREERREVRIVDRMKRTLGEFLDEVKKLRGNDFQFRFYGFQLANVKLEQIDFGALVHARTRNEYRYNECNEYVYMKNYQLIEPGAFDFVSAINYSVLLRHVTGEVPRCFSQKFTGVNSVEAKGAIEDPEQFLWFLKSLKFLRRLALEKTRLNQEFYDQLPESACSLTRLKVDNGHRKNELNFDFVGKLPCLSMLAIRPSLRSYESVTSLLRWLDRLERYEFSCSTQRS